MEHLQEKLPKDVFQKLQVYFESPKELLLSTSVDLQRICNLSETESKLVQQETCSMLLQDKIKKASDVSEWSKLRTGCENVDQILNGGISARGITEIYGQSSTGKTQLALQLAIMVQFPKYLGGFAKGAVYICTEDIFPSKRLHQLAQTIPTKYQFEANNNFEDNIYIEHIADYEQLRRALYVRIPNLLSKISIGLIIVDSIAGAFRSESGDYVNRSEEFYSVGKKLTELSKQYNLAAVCVNQVVDKPDTGQVEPCLGFSWGNLITSRFELSRIGDSKIRRFQIINAPDLRSADCQCIIDECGLSSYN